MLEIARFWSLHRPLQPGARPLGDPRRHGPGRVPREAIRTPTEGGLRNNAYTNVMVAWICETAQTVLDLLPASRRDALRAKIGLGDEELRQVGAR